MFNISYSFYHSGKCRSLGTVSPDGDARRYEYVRVAHHHVAPARMGTKVPENSKVAHEEEGTASTS